MMSEDTEYRNRLLAEVLQIIRDRVSQHQEAGRDIIESPQIINLGTIIYGRGPNEIELKELIAQLIELLKQNKLSPEELIAQLQQRGAVPQGAESAATPPASAATHDTAEDCVSLRRQRDSIKETLEIIAEKKTRYASPTNIPEQLEKDERYWQRELAKIEQKIKEQCGGNPPMSGSGNPPPPDPPTPTPEPPTSPKEPWQWLKIMGFTLVDKAQYAIIFHTHRVPNPRQTSADFFVDEFLYKCSLYNDGKVLRSVKLNDLDLHSTSLMNGLIFAAPATGKTVYAQALKRMLSKQICIYEVRNLQGRDNNVTNWEDQITRTINADLYINGDNNRFSERFFSDLQQKGYSRIVIIADPFRSNSLGNHADSRQHLEALLSICQEQDNVQGFFFLPDSYREVLENFLEDTAHFDLYCIRLDNTRPHESFRRILDKRFGYYLGSGNLPGSGEVAAATGVPTQKLFGDTVDSALEEIARASKGSIRKMLRLTRDILEAHVEQLNNESSEKVQAPIPLDTVERVCSQWH